MEIRPATPDRWGDLADLFERKDPRGGQPMPAGCWCMWWRHRAGDAETNRAAMEQLVGSGVVPGLLAYEGDRAIGWVSVAPQSHAEGTVARPLWSHLVRSRGQG